jgi:hypothetical protein
MIATIFFYNLGYSQTQNQNEIKKTVLQKIKSNHPELVRKYPRLDSIVHYIVKDLSINAMKEHNCSNQHLACEHNEKFDSDKFSESAVFIVVNFLTNLEKYPYEKDFRIYPNRNYALKKFIK